MTTKSKSYSRRPKAVIILDLLLAGLPMQFPNDPEIYWYQDGVFGVQRTRLKTDDPSFSEEVILGVDITLPQFIKMCDSMTDNEVYIKGCEAVLRSHNQVRR